MSAKILIAFGFVWMVVAALFGLILGSKHDDHVQSLIRAAGQMDLSKFYDDLESYKWRATVHAHGMLFSLTSVVIGLCLPHIGFGHGISTGLAGATITATVLWSLSSLRRVRMLMAVSDLLFIGAISTTAWGVIVHL